MASDWLIRNLGTERHYLQGEGSICVPLTSIPRHFVFFRFDLFLFFLVFGFTGSLRINKVILDACIH